MAIICHDFSHWLSSITLNCLSFYIYVCVYICVYVCTHTHIYIYIYFILLSHHQNPLDRWEKQGSEIELHRLTFTDTVWNFFSLTCHPLTWDSLSIHQVAWPYSKRARLSNLEGQAIQSNRVSLVGTRSRSLKNLPITMSVLIPGSIRIHWELTYTIIALKYPDSLCWS
jgi:hypothetical protein